MESLVSPLVSFKKEANSLSSLVPGNVSSISLLRSVSSPSSFQYLLLKVINVLLPLKGKSIIVISWNFLFMTFLSLFSSVKGGMSFSVRVMVACSSKSPEVVIYSFTQELSTQRNSQL